MDMLRNLACHAKPQRVMVETKGFVSMVVKQFFVNDAPSLSKACRCWNLSRTLNVQTKFMYGLVHGSHVE